MKLLPTLQKEDRWAYLLPSHLENRERSRFSRLCTLGKNTCKVYSFAVRSQRSKLADTDSAGRRLSLMLPGVVSAVMAL